MRKLDGIDRRILRVLQENGRIQNVELAEKVGLSPSPCLRRVKMLEESGVIERYVALLDASKINVGLTVFARIWLTGQDAETVEHFVAEVRGLPQVVECHLMAGDCDFLLRIVAADLRGLPAVPDRPPDPDRGRTERQDRRAHAEDQAHLGAPALTNAAPDRASAPNRASGERDANQPQVRDQTEPSLPTQPTHSIPGRRNS